MEELTVVMLLRLPAIMGSFVALADAQNSSWMVLLSPVTLYSLGSYWNTYSEWRRKIWKQDPRHQGRCYTLGLFSWSRNINYFGDTVLFAGWAVATADIKNAWVPLVMGLSFYF